MGGTDFEVTVINTSRQFASFQVELSADEIERSKNSHWYKVEPHICAKKPPGDRTTFKVTILKSPIPSYGITIPITIKLLSAELGIIPTQEQVFLKVLWRDSLKTYLPFAELQGYPGERIKIPVLVYNLSAHLREVTVRMSGLKSKWLPEGSEQSVLLGAGDSRELFFACAPPLTPQSQSKDYSFEARASWNENTSTSTAVGTLHVLPFGVVEFGCRHPVQWLASRRSSSNSGKQETATFLLEFANQSNLSLRVQLSEEKRSQKPFKHHGLPPIDLEPEGTNRSPFMVFARRPWLGTTRSYAIEVEPQLLSAGTQEPISTVALKPSARVLTAKAKPRIPFWLQLLSGFVGLLLLWLAWWLNPKTHHRAPISSLTLMANGSMVVSGSSDQTLRRWQVNRDAWLPGVRRLKYEDIIAGPEIEDVEPLTKAIRVVQHIPREVNQVAVGTEDGEVQIWNIDPPRPGITFSEQGQPDRVFGLDFTDDSEFLFTGHGSGFIRRWSNNEAPEAKLYPNPNFSITAIRVIETPNTSLLAVVGQFNQFLLWDWETEEAYYLPYQLQNFQPENFFPTINRNSYLTDIAAAYNINIAATADNNGFISLWNVATIQQCINAKRVNDVAPEYRYDGFGNRFFQLNCPEALTTQWKATADGEAIRSIALSDNGCFLSSVGDDGRVMVWPLTKTGEQVPNQVRGLAIKRYANSSLNSVDIHYTEDDTGGVVLVATDTPTNRVRLFRRGVNNNDCR